MADLLVNQFFQREFMDDLGAMLATHHQQWDQHQFLSKIYAKGWEDKALLVRMQHISQVLRDLLPPDYQQAIGILLKASAGSSGFNGMVFSDFVGQFGLDHLEESLHALEQFTQVGSGEFAIRQFILRYEKITMERMLQWTQHESEHVRRLASEGCRPRLPWAVALPKYKKDPSPVLPILEQLKADPSKYVQKSVANHLNDLTKDNSELVLDLLEGWKEGASSDTQWIIKHALRGLIKSGDKRALRLLGFEEVKVSLSNFLLDSPSVTLGGSLTFRFDIKNRGKKKAQVSVDFVIHFVKANGSTAPKVFKLKNLSLDAGQTTQVEKNHGIKPITTRKYYSGTHKLSIQVNGNVLGEKEFELNAL